MRFRTRPTFPFGHVTSRGGKKKTRAEIKKLSGYDESRTG